MKILVFTYSISRTAGGVLDAVRDLFTNAAFKQQELKILSFRDKYCDTDIPAWNGLPMQLFKPGFMLYSPEARKALLATETDILHMETLWRFPHLWMADWKKRYRNKPLVCSPHGMFDPYIIRSQGKIKRIIADLFFQKGLEAVDCYHALCRKELEDIRAYGLKQPVAIIPNGINLPDSTKVFHREDNKLHLLYLGRLHRQKGIDILLKAIAEIKNGHPGFLNKWHVDVVGWDHENCKAELEKIAREGQIQDSVTFHGGLFGEEKIRMYATSDAYILPSHGEGLPMTVLEAWSWHLPVLMTLHCHIPEGFDADAAIRIDDNVLSVKNGLMALFGLNDRQREEMGDRGYRLVKEKFTWEASAEKMIRLYTWLSGKTDKPDFVYL